METPCIWRFANVEFDELQWELRVGGQVVEVEPRPLDLLQTLLRHAGEVIEKNDLIEAIYGHLHIGDGALTNALGKLRKVIGDTDQKIIVTVHRVGYRFAASVQRIEPQAVAAVAETPGFKVGDTVPARENWLLQRLLGKRTGSEVWQARHALTGEQHVFKFAIDGRGLRALRRENSLSQVLREALGPRPDFVPVREVNFQQAPFFLESVYAGLSLSEWCEQRGGIGEVPLALRVELLARIAETVAAAHSVGVLHKDLKPQNVLVDEAADGSLQVRVTDFGSGRLLGKNWAEQLGLTQIDETVTQTILNDSTSGTLRYLAPEVLRGQSATVQADVYALGVMLYQLVVADFRKSPTAGWERDIADPLLREDIADAAEGDPARRLSDLVELARRLRSLDQRRAERAAAEAAQTEAQRKQKEIEFLRARRTGLQVALGVLIVGFVITGVLAWRISQAEKRATLEAKRANTVITFLNRDLLATIGDGDIPLHDLTVRQMLESAYKQVDERFKDDPAAAARVYASLATSFERLSELEPAARSVDRALALFDQTEGPGSESALKLTQTLFTTKYTLGKLDEAIPQIEQMIAAGEKRLGPAHEAVLQAKLELARGLYARGEMLAARDTLREMATALGDKPEPAQKAVEAQVLRLLGVIEYGFGDRPNAETHLRNALAVATELYGADHRRVAGIRAALAGAVQRLGNTSEADRLFDECEATIARWEEDDSSDVLLRVKMLRAEALIERDQAADAVPVLKSALVAYLSKPRAPEERSQLFFPWAILAEAQLRSGDLAGSDQTLADALAAVRPQMPIQLPDRWVLELDEAEHRLLHQDTAAVRSFLEQPQPGDFVAMERKRVQWLRVKGLLARATGQPVEAKVLLQQALDQARTSFGPAHWQTQRLIAELAQP